MTFLVGLLIGVVVASLFFWLWLLQTARGSLRARFPDPRGQVSGLERQTIHHMLAAEMAMQQQRSDPGDVIEGTAREIVPRP